ncbi:RRP12-like protein [Macrosteles quadrilineatus]|uniref:RRP12-like protein n=1 Tax=Macrosteles quadrilineatus TaxID=74068 RepID=UPI0023E16FAD|nr:RRP12-like protein [Macrosteles quadrilineatus]
MGKTRIRLKGAKGKRWAKGHSSSSNPQTTKHRDAAKSRFFQENLSLPSSLTTEALKKHNAFTFGAKKKTDEMEVEDDAQSASTFKTVDTFASDWSACSNKSFNMLLTQFRPDSEIHKEMLAILAAVTEVIKSQGGKESNTEYFGALMTTLSDVELEETPLAATLYLLQMGIRGVPTGVLQSRFSQCSKIFLDILSKYAENENNVIMRGLFSCISVLLRAQELGVWKDHSTKKILESMLIFTVHSKPKVRKAAQKAVGSVLKKSSMMQGDNPPPHHPAATIVADFCVRQMEKHGAGTTTLHVLGMLKEILATFPRSHLKTSCETILKVMTLGNILINSCGLQALHGLFVSRPSPAVLPAELNAKLIAALYDYQPSAVDAQPTQAWLAVMQEAFINLNKLDQGESVANLPHLFLLLTTLWLSDKPEVLTATTLTMRALVEEVVGPAAALPQHRTAVANVIATVQAGLKYQYHAAWTHVLHVIGVLFKVCGEHCVDRLTPCLQELADLRDSHQFCFTSELDHAVGQAVRSMGPDVVIRAIPLQLKGSMDTAQEFKRSWILPILKENIQKSTLKCFIDQFMPLAVMCRNQSAKFAAENNQVRSLSYDLMQTQLWALLPSFCSQPADIATFFSGIAKPLGSMLSNQKDQRLSVMSALRRLITYARDNQRQQDVAELARFAKNYLPILFNQYTTPAKGTDEEGIRLATLETIKVYLSISNEELTCELFDRALAKLDSLAKGDNFVRESVLDLLRTLSVHQKKHKVAELYSRTVAKLKEVSDHKEQKKYYRILEDLCAGDSEGCKQFFDDHIEDIKGILLESLSKSAVNSKGPRLRCLLLLLDHARTSTQDLIASVVPEAVLCCKDNNAKCRQTAYELLHKMADVMADRGLLDRYLEMIMAGLVGSQQLTSATLLALAAITHHSRETMPEDLVRLVFSNVCLLCCSASREIVGSALSYLKVFITSMDNELVAQSVPNIMKVMVGMTEDCKRHFRTKTRDLLARLVRWYGADNVIALMPETEKVMRARLRNMRKIQARKTRKWAELREAKANNKDDEEDDQFSVKSKLKSIDDILADLDDSDMELDEMVDDKPKTKTKKKSNVYIREGADDIVDFTDISTTKKISSSRPDQVGFGQSELQKKKKKESSFKTAPDGRLIIKDHSDSDDEPRKKPGHIPGLSDSEDEDDEFNEARSTVSSVAQNRKRHLSTSSVATSSTMPAMKYQAGGVGIHRPIKKTKPGTKQNLKGSLGSEYKSKKAQGDVKRKGLPDPYAYVPLRKDALNRRKRAKAVGQFKNILKGAKKGAVIGAKNKMKMKMKQKKKM